MSHPIVAIVGRPNVGKSTLFNRLVGFRKSTVHDRPGVTRDRLYEEAEFLGRSFILIDTGGIESAPDTPLLEAMRLQSMVAVEEADVILFLVDGRQGWTAADTEVAELLRRSSKPIVMAVNKLDGPRHDDLLADFYEAGIDPILAISAAHNRNMYELAAAIIDALPPELATEPMDGVIDPWAAEQPEDDELDDDDFDDDGEEPLADVPIRIAVVGRPNIGKSTLINQLLGHARHLVHDMPGTTMDPIDSPLHSGGRDYVLVDTAGVRRKSRIDDRLERFISLRSIKSIERCHVCLLVIDASEGITDQDARLAQLIIDRGRALIVVMNKWDLVRDLEDVDAASVEDAIETNFPHAPWAPHLFISALTGKGVHRVFPTVNKVFEEFNRRISTSELNRFLELAVATHSVPQQYHRPVRLLYAHQLRVRPPTIVFFSNTPEGVAPAYRRYLQNRLREAYGFQGTPLRLHFKKRRKPGEEAG